MTGAEIPCTLLLVVATYMLPTGVAAARELPNTPAIAAWNVVTGWTGIGWLVILTWAAFGGHQRRQ